ncbi:MAG: diguanylate cyclase [Candidatus Izemoplasmataceae bacterium]
MNIFSDITLIPLISSILYILLLLIITTSTKTKLSASFSLYIGSMIVWSLGSFLMKTNLPPSSLFWNKFLQIGFLTVPVFLLRFSYEFYNKDNRDAVLRVAYFLSGSLIILSMFGFVVKEASFEDGVFIYEIGLGAYVVAVVGTFYSILALVNIVRSVKVNKVEFHKVKWVIVGLSLVIVGAALNLNTEIGQYGIDILFNLLNALLITFAIYKNKFLEINLIVKKGLSFIIYHTLLFVLYIFTVLTFFSALNRLGLTNPIGQLILLLPVFFILEPIRLLIFKLTRHIFYRESMDRQDILKEFSNIINTELSTSNITKSMIVAIQKGLSPIGVTIFLKQENAFTLMRTSIDGFEDEKVSFRNTHPIIKWFLNDRDLLLKSHLDNHVIFKGLWDKEKLLLQRLYTEFIMPLRYNDELVGLAIVAPRQDATPYVDSEIEFLQTLLNNASAIMENAKQFEEVKKEAITDELTGLYNHRFFYETANEWLQKDKYHSFTIAMIDIDHFKIYNDLYGHSAGDAALKRIADIIKGNLYEEDFLVRYGGEEFLLYLPLTMESDAFRAIEKVRKNIENAFLHSSDIREFLTVSVGAATYPLHGKTIEEIVNKADLAVKKGKKTGRNKAILYSDAELEKTQYTDDIQEKIDNAYLSSIYALAATIDAKDHYTFGHSNNVALLSKRLAKEMGYDEATVDLIHSAGLLHDIGKVGIPEQVLSKPGVLTPEEREIMESHVLQSISIIKHIPNLVETVPIIISHHEHYDGTGYPRQIKKESIPKLGRILCLADSYDAMTTDRPYRKGLTSEQAIYEIKRCEGTQFDPEVCEVMIELIKSGEIDKLPLENRSRS